MQEAYPRSLWLAVSGALFGAFQFGECEYIVAQASTAGTQLTVQIFLPVPAGYQVGVLNTALPFIAKDLHYHKQGVLSSAVVLGAAAGAITAGKLADALGPRHAQVCWGKHHMSVCCLFCIAASTGDFVVKVMKHIVAV